MMFAKRDVTTQTYRVAESRFAVACDSVEARRIWETYGRKYCLVVLASIGITSNCGRIEIYTKALASPLQLNGWSVEEVEHGSCWTNGSELWLTIAGSHLLVTSTPTPRVQVWLSEASEAQTDAALDAVIAYALTALLRRCNCYTLHAAGLLEPNHGQGILIVGDSGSGKSTLTVRLLQQGWRYLSDDQIALASHSDGIRAWGLRRVFSLTTQTINACWDELNEETLPNQKRLIEPCLLFTGQSAAQCRPTAIFFTKLNPMTTVTPIAPSEAMLKLIRQCPWLCYDPAIARDYAQVLTKLTAQCRTYQLAAGRDLLERPDLAHELLTAYLD